MRTLVQGHKQFHTEHFPGLQSHFASLANGQTPHTLFVTCSDSRIDPSLITQTLPGELFILRNAGNLIPIHGEDDGSASAVEYAIDALGVELIVVCGHHECGAMGGLLDPESLSELPTVARWIKHADSTKSAVISGECENKVHHASRHNALQQLVNLESHPSVKRALHEGRLILEAWIYRVDTGTIEVLGTESEHV